MHRRAGLILLVVLALAACTNEAGSPPTRASSQRAEDRPNVLIFVTDDQPLEDTMKVMPKTRAFFGKDGTRFTDAFATTPLCCPSRSSIFTGRYAHNHGVERNGKGSGENLDQETTLQRYLQDEGYRTAIFGKYLNAWDLTVDPPHFDEWAIIPGGKAKGYSGGDWNVNGSLETVAQYSTGFIEDLTTAFLENAESDDDRPWLMYVTVYAPHPPFIPQETFVDTALPKWDPPPSVGETDVTDKPDFVQRAPADVVDSGAAIRKKQMRTLLSVDGFVGRLGELLERTGEADDTLAFFLSDNGYMWGQHRLTKKATSYTPSIKVPLYARWPDHFGTGVKDRRVVGLLDITPTILGALGIDPDIALDGRDLLDTAVGRDDILIEYWPNRRETYPGWAGLRGSDFQYTEYYEADLQTVIFREYYDLDADKHQLVNLLGDGDDSNDPDVEELSRELGGARDCSGPSCP